MFKPHYRLTMAGTLPDDEIWNCTLSLVPDNSAWAELVTDISLADYLRENVNEPDLFDDIVDDCTAYHGRLETFIDSSAVLKRVTLAPIGADGRYAGAPKEAAVNTPGYSTGFPMPHQIARKITLETDSDLGRVKGGFYQPKPSGQEFDYGTDLWSVNVVTQVRASVTQFINDLNNAPGLDETAVKVVIASQGRHNHDGTVRQGPGNFDVARVNVGRRADVQRRRANKLSEARISDAVVA